MSIVLSQIILLKHHVTLVLLFCCYVATSEDAVGGEYGELAIEKSAFMRKCLTLPQVFKLYSKQ